MTHEDLQTQFTSCNTYTQILFYSNIEVFIIDISITYIFSGFYPRMANSFVPWWPQQGGSVSGGSEVPAPGHPPDTPPHCIDIV